jgi:hypothetical protein
MNIFILDYDMRKNVQYYIDAHVRKMLVEYTQILSTVCRLNGLDCGYKATHVNHPCVKWCLESFPNWIKLYALTCTLYLEYEYRFDKVHKTKDILANLERPLLPTIDEGGLISITLPPLIMPDKYKTNDIVESYRNYYRNEKRTDKNGKNMAIWTNRDAPEWF